MGLQKYRADKPGEVQSNGAIPFYTEWIGGPTLALIRKCPVENAPIPPRTVYIRGEADTWFSVPAVCQYRGQIITGYVTTNDMGEYVFRAHTNQGAKS